MNPLRRIVKEVVSAPMQIIAGAVEGLAKSLDIVTGDDKRKEK